MANKTLDSESERLESAINDLKSKLDLQNQEIHKFTNAISLAKVLELEYVEEIESVQNTKSSIDQNLDQEIKRAKDNLANLKVRRLAEVAQKSKTIEELKSQIKERKRALTCKVKSDQKNDDVDQATKRNCELKNEIGLVTVELEKLEENYDDLNSQNQELSATQELFMNKLEGLKNSLKVKTKELTRIQGLIQELKETNFENKLKLDSLKCKPLDPTKKGNSMFGEVEDSCVKLQRNLQQMKKFHSSIEEELKDDFEKMTYLVLDNARLKKNLKEPKIYENVFQVELEKLQSAVPILETKLEEYKSEILGECEFVAKDSSSFNFEYVTHRMKSLWKEVIQTGDELNTASQEVLNTFKTLEDTNKNSREKMRHNFLLECTLDELDFALLQLERNVDFNEITKMFNENLFVAEIINGSKAQKKPLQENNISNNSSENELAKKEESVNLFIKNDETRETENSKLCFLDASSNACKEISNEVEKSVESDFEVTEPPQENVNLIVERLENNKLNICTRIPVFSKK